jgi:hypothetical protein
VIEPEKRAEATFDFAFCSAFQVDFVTGTYLRKSDRGRARQISARLTRAFRSSNARSHAHAAYFTSSLLCFFTELT